MKIKKVFVKKRFFKKYQTKKRLLAVFLVIVNFYIWADVIISLPKINFKWEIENTTFVVENHTTGQFLKPSEVVTVKELSVEDKIRAVFGNEAEIAIAIAKSESGLKNVKGDTHIEFIQDGKVMGHSCGVFQVRVLSGRPSCEELMDVDVNIAYAKKIYDKVGWSAWSNYKNERYLAFLDK